MKILQYLLLLVAFTWAGDTGNVEIKELRDEARSLRKHAEDLTEESEELDDRARDLERRARKLLNQADDMQDLLSELKENGKLKSRKKKDNTRNEFITKQEDLIESMRLQADTLFQKVGDISSKIRELNETSIAEEEYADRIYQKVAIMEGKGHNFIDSNRVHHVVLVWLKESGNRDQRDLVITESKKLKSIPGILDLKVGSVIPSDRDIVDDSFDVGLVMTFKSVEEMNTYLVHPDHVKLVKETLKPVVKKIVVYDIWE